MQRLNTRSVPLTRAQAAFVSPVTVTSDKAQVIKVLGDGLTKDANDVALVTVLIRMVERPGQPVRLTAKDELAHILDGFAQNGTRFAFEANVSGNPIPYLFATSLESLPDQD